MGSIKESFLLVVLCVAASFSPSLSTPTGTRCPAVPNQPSCVCETENGIIDLTKAASDDGVARYQGMEDPNNYVYEFNPCYTFTAGGECIDVYVCQELKDPPTSYKIADPFTEQIWIDENNMPYIFYTSQNGIQYREVFVHLVCDKSVSETKVTTIGDSRTTLTYEFTLTSCHACPGGCGSGGGVAAGIAGIILMLLLIVGIVSYFVVGAIIMKVHFRRDGIDIIPQKNLWFAVPGLIKEGFIFTFKPVYDLIKGIKNKNSSGYKQEL